MARAELICWLDEDIKEAEVRISDGYIALTAFCSSFAGNRESDEITLSTLGAKEAVADEKFLPPVQEGLAGEMSAVIADRKENILRLGNIVIEFDGYIQGDAVDGQLLRFRFARLDYLE